MVSETLCTVMTGALVYGNWAIRWAIRGPRKLTWAGTRCGCRNGSRTLCDRGCKCLEMIDALLYFLSCPCESEKLQGGCRVSTGHAGT